MSNASDLIETRPPSLLDALIPVFSLIVLIATATALFGTDATEGPLQVALLLSASVAGLIARKNGHAYVVLSEAIVGGVSTAMGAIFILLAVGSLIGTWNLSGTTATVVYYGVKLLEPQIFFPAVAFICAVVGAVTGSSWTTAGTIGVAFMGMAKILDVNPAIAAGAVISGSYLGDKMTPLSETTILVPKLVGGVEVIDHIKALLWTTGPAFIIALVLYLIIAQTHDTNADAAQKQAALDAIGAIYWISLVNLLPLLLLVYLSIRRYPPFLSILFSALLAGVMAGITQPDIVRSFSDDAGLGIFGATVKAIFSSMANGFVLDSGVPGIDALFSRGGMSSMLSTIWLVLAALSFASVMEYAGFLQRLVEPVLNHARSDGTLIAAVAGSCIGLNVIAGDQYVADVLPARTYRSEFARRGIMPVVLSRVVDDTGTVTSPLVPWNSCGAYMSGTLGVSTFDYFPYCFLNLINPVISVAYGFIGFQVKRFTTPAVEAVDVVESAEQVGPTIESERQAS